MKLMHQIERIDNHGQFQPVDRESYNQRSVAVSRIDELKAKEPARKFRVVPYGAMRQ